MEDIFKDWHNKVFQFSLHWAAFCTFSFVQGFPSSPQKLVSTQKAFRRWSATMQEYLREESFAILPRLFVFPHQVDEKKKVKASVKLFRKVSVLVWWKFNINLEREMVLSFGCKIIRLRFPLCSMQFTCQLKTFCGRFHEMWFEKFPQKPSSWTLFSLHFIPKSVLNFHATLGDCEKLLN